jgi:hypothetical protein
MARYNASAHTKEQNDDHANQFNPTSPAYRARMNNRSNQLNPNNPKYQGSVEQSDDSSKVIWDNLFQPHVNNMQWANTQKNTNSSFFH